MDPFFGYLAIFSAALFIGGYFLIFDRTVARDSQNRPILIEECTYLNGYSDFPENEIGFLKVSSAEISFVPERLERSIRFPMSMVTGAELEGADKGIVRSYIRVVGNTPLLGPPANLRIRLNNGSAPRHLFFLLSAGKMRSRYICDFINRRSSRQDISCQAPKTARSST